MAVAVQPALSSLKLGYNVVHGGEQGFACMAERTRDSQAGTDSCAGVRPSAPLASALRAQLVDSQLLEPLPLASTRRKAQLGGAFSMCSLDGV